VVRLQRQTVRARHTLALAGGALSPVAEEYLDVYSRLYRAIAEVTVATLIVDSSKVPAGAALLTRMPDVRPYLLHMVRDPRAVTHSWTRAAPPPEKRRNAAPIYQRPASSTVHWVIRNALTERLAGSFPNRHVRLRYEDFAENPREVIERVLSLTGTPASDGPFLDDHTVELDPNHTIAGNPSRFRSGKISLRNDDRWRSEQPRGPRLTATALALPLLHHYGYRAKVRKLNGEGRGAQVVLRDVRHCRALARQVRRRTRGDWRSRAVVAARSSAVTPAARRRRHRTGQERRRLPMPSTSATPPAARAICRISSIQSMPLVSSTPIAAAMKVPIRAATTPISRVSQKPIFCLPGSTRRPRPPMMRPMMMAVKMPEISIRAPNPGRRFPGPAARTPPGPA
jgi:hypothetical protein